MNWGESAEQSGKWESRQPHITGKSKAKGQIENRENIGWSASIQGCSRMGSRVEGARRWHVFSEGVLSGRGSKSSDEFDRQHDRRFESCDHSCLQKVWKELFFPYLALLSRKSVCADLSKGLLNDRKGPPVVIVMALISRSQKAVGNKIPSISIV
jgi:hypothetical protein